MAIATTWVPYVNGATGLAVRTALNNFNTNILADMISTEGRVTVNETDISAIEVAATALDGRVTVNESDIVSLDGRLTTIEESHSLILTATSVALTQEPTAVDTPLQIEFGPLQTTTEIDVSAAGAFTFKVAGKYIISPFFQYGRSGASGTSFLLNRYKVNGVQLGSSLAAKIDNASVLVPWSSSIQFTAEVGDVVTVELMRDSGGVNSGGLFALDPVPVGWNIAPCAAIQIYKAT